MSLRVIKKVTARVFCIPSSTANPASARTGGNPVTIFVAPTETHHHHCERQTLARSCLWESVLVGFDEKASSEHDTAGTRILPSPILHFFMPSGEQVSFCAHAAMGAAHVLATLSSSSPNSHLSTTLELQPSMLRSSEPHTAVVRDVHTSEDNQSSSNVGLRMNTVYHEEAPIPLNQQVSELLRSIGLSPFDILQGSQHSIVNASVARPKTLIPVKSVDVLHAATAPSDPNHFSMACDAVHSTGLYLYAPVPQCDLPAATKNAAPVAASYECRQFPRASGYPEDPATGIAAAALAIYLERTKRLDRRIIMDNTDHPTSVAYTVYQGTAMGRPSMIRIRDIKVEPSQDPLQTTTTLSCWGNVHVDSIEAMEL